jgi:hypothetical protein
MRVQDGPNDQQQGSGGGNQKDRGQEAKPTLPASALLDHFHDVPRGPGAGLGRMGAKKH